MKKREKDVVVVVSKFMVEKSLLSSLLSNLLNPLKWSITMWKTRDNYRVNDVPKVIHNLLHEFCTRYATAQGFCS